MSDFKAILPGYQEILRDIEACRKYGTDYSLERGKTARLVERLHPRRLKLRVSEIITKSPTTDTFRLVAREGYLPPFQAGQYINLFLNIDGIKTSRPYTISSSPRQTAYYDITIRRVPDGLVSNYLLDNILSGYDLESSGPAGNFYYNPLFHGKNQLLLAGGSGITPFMSMIREVTDAGLDRNIHLVYGNRSSNDIIFHAELWERSLRHFNFHYHPVVEEPEKYYHGRVGTINIDMLQEILAGEIVDSVMVCGPQAMYDALLPHLWRLGVPERRIRHELFMGPADITQEAGWPPEVNSESQFNVDINNRETITAKAGEPLLTALENAGIVVPVLCRSGECSQCRVQLLSGEVYQPAGVLLRESDRKYGYVHSCKAYPLSDLAIRLG